MKKINLIKWGNNHKRYITNHDKAKLEAYYKAFYFDNVALNGVLVKR